MSLDIASGPDLRVRRRSEGASPDRAARAVAVLALGVVSAAHVPPAIEHLEHIPYLGYAFVALVLVSAAAAGSLLVESRRMVWWIALLVCAAAVTAYVVSRSVGLPLADDDIGDWVNRLGVVAVLSELVVVSVAVRVLRRRTT